MDINKENLDKAVSSSGSEGQGQPQQDSGSQGQNMSQDEEIGFHKGALNTLVNERSELLKMAQNVEGVMQQHIKRLQELGVDVQSGQDQSGQQQQ